MYVFTNDKYLATNWGKEGSFDKFEWLTNDYERYATENEAINSIKRKALDILNPNTPEFIDITNKILKISQYIVSIQTEKMKDTLLFRNWRCKK